MIAGFHLPAMTPMIVSEHLPRIFDRVHKRRDSHGSGLGLGLAIARPLVLAHGGDIHVKSGRWAGDGGDGLAAEVRVNEKKANYARQRGSPRRGGQGFGSVILLLKQCQTMIDDFLSHSRFGSQTRTNFV